MKKNRVCTKNHLVQWHRCLNKYTPFLGISLIFRARQGPNMSNIECCAWIGGPLFPGRPKSLSICHTPPLVTPTQVSQTVSGACAFCPPQTHLHLAAGAPRQHPFLPSPRRRRFAPAPLPTSSPGAGAPRQRPFLPPPPARALRAHDLPLPPPDYGRFAPTTSSFAAAARALRAHNLPPPPQKYTGGGTDI